jgi:Fe-Mn family superoxide dismutase
MSKRRTFIKHLLLQGIAIGISTKLAEATVSTFHRFDKSDNTDGFGFDQQPLPYSFNALEPVIDAQTMELHYSKHAAAYCKNLKEAMANEKVNADVSLETLLAEINKYSDKMKNNAGGHYNHELFWACMRRPASENNSPNGNLLNLINHSFGSEAAFRQKMNQSALAVFGSGWTWLVLEGKDKLKIVQTKNQENPLMGILSDEQKGFPLFGIDVWEHAYYLKYQNRRAEYVTNWWKIAHWDYIENRLNQKINRLK